MGDGGWRAELDELRQTVQDLSQRLAAADERERQREVALMLAIGAAPGQPPARHLRSVAPVVALGLPAALGPVVVELLQLIEQQPQVQGLHLDHPAVQFRPPHRIMLTGCGERRHIGVCAFPCEFPWHLVWYLPVFHTAEPCPEPAGGQATLKPAAVNR